MESISRKQIIAPFAMLASVAMGATNALAQAQEVARVVSVTPNVRQVQTPKLVCTFDAYKNQTCVNQLITQNVNDGFNVVYEFDGRLFTMFSATDPGPYVQLNVAQPSYAPPVTTYVQPQVITSGYAPGYSAGYTHSAFPVPVAPIIVRPHGYGFVPRPVVVIRGGGGHYGGHHGGNYGGHRGFSQGHHGGRGHYR
jgi:hypothetical protein